MGLDRSRSWTGTLVVTDFVRIVIKYLKGLVETPAFFFEKEVV